MMMNKRHNAEFLGLTGRLRRAVIAGPLTAGPSTDRTVGAALFVSGPATIDPFRRVHLM